MPICKALEIMGSETYLDVRRNKPARCCSRWAFFSGLLNLKERKTYVRF